MSIVVEVRLWGRTIGAAAMLPNSEVVSFQYAKEFAESGIEVSPLAMPLRPQPYQFPELSRATFHGLPGLLADSLPDKFGNAMIDNWLARQGRDRSDFNVLERLCYTGRRGMGALEYRPMRGPRPGGGSRVEIEQLVQLASAILSGRESLAGNFSEASREKAMRDILRVGTSAGGARAKALIAWNAVTGEVRSGQVAAGEGFNYWLIKFDGVRGNRDKELEDPSGFGAIEYGYYLMAKAAGMQMSECRLLEDHGRRHFMTRRFDRTSAGEKLHMQSLCAMAHYDFNMAGAFSYEQAIQVMKKLNLNMDAVEEQYRRMCFNIIARNQDDHVKNIAFLMNKAGFWMLSPAYDVTYSYNPDGAWTSEHQMTVNGKRRGFAQADLLACASVGRIKKARALAIIDQVTSAVKRWAEFAERAGVGLEVHKKIANAHRLELKG